MRWLLAAMLLVGCGPRTVLQSGEASWYGKDFRGRPTASGEPFRPSKRTAAHPNLPFGTMVKVRRLDNGRTVRVRINDRGPYAKGRIIDLSRRAARRLHMIEDGVAPVELRVVGCRGAGARCR